MKGKKEISLRTGFIGIVIACWLIPILLTVGVVGFYMFSTHLDGKMEETEKSKKYFSNIRRKKSRRGR